MCPVLMLQTATLPGDGCNEGVMCRIIKGSETQTILKDVAQENVH